ncbi:MAG: DAK2 domain-containing protein [Chloroflexota bacterium]|nr:DAK2 domain-containing protein [Chloroflexota bacterium]
MEHDEGQTSTIPNNSVGDDSIQPEAAPSIWGRACSGTELKRALLASAIWLEKHTEAINALNVFPVPDGDTGTNMSRTMEAAVKELEQIEEGTAEQISKRLSFGALMGARGNSGVILSQIIRGLAEGLSAKDHFTARDMAFALGKARDMAYKAVMKPVEGTILTVVRETAEAAEAAAYHHDNFIYVLTKAVEAAHESVARTPTLLDKLREAGVVDAGGHGFYVLLEGALKHIRGESLELADLSDPLYKKATIVDDGAEHKMDEYGYCTNFMLYANVKLNFEEVRDRIAAMGNSAVIVGDTTLIKVHVHTEDPGAILSYATSLGALGQIKLDNMQLQHEEAFRETTVGKTTPTDEPEHGLNLGLPGQISIVSVAAGKGLAEVFKNLGVSAVIHGGQTMNPSTQEMLKAIDKLPNQDIIILPNNKNIILVAQQVQALTSKRVAVVPTATVPQGITALLNFNFEESLEENLARMKVAVDDVTTGEVTRAVRNATVNGVTVVEGQWIGLLDDELSLAAESKEEAVWQLLDKMEAAVRELITFYYGEDVSEPEAEILKAQVEARYPSSEVTFVRGDQPHYHYIISVE